MEGLNIWDSGWGWGERGIRYKALGDALDIGFRKGEGRFPIREG